MSWLDVLGLGADVLNAGYNAWTNKRDFDYQKSLQNEIFAREDNSVQRRVKDLQAAGLNPALAAGQGAGAGSVVSRSNTDSLGANLDTIQAINQIRLQKQETNNKKIEGDIFKKELDLKNLQQAFDQASLLTQFGVDFGIKPVTENGQLKIKFNIDNKAIHGIDTNLSKEYMSKLNQILTQEELLNKDANWYTADKISGMALGLLSSIPLNFSFGNYKSYKK